MYLHFERMAIACWNHCLTILLDQFSFYLRCSLFSSSVFLLLLLFACFLLVLCSLLISPARSLSIFTGSTPRTNLVLAVVIIVDSVRSKHIFTFFSPLRPLCESGGGFSAYARLIICVGVCVCVLTVFLVFR